MSRIRFLGTNYTDLTITFAYGSRRYEYQFHFPGDLDTALYLTRKVSIGKALAWSKKRAKLLEPAA